MPRRYRPEHRIVEPDIRFNSPTVAVFVNKVMHSGKKSVARSLIYGAMDIIAERTGKDPLDTFDQAIRNASPVMEVKPRRVGGATYQVPTEVEPLRWLLAAARSRPGKTFAQKFADEILDAAKNTGTAIKRREDTHRMAEANKAFAHYRW
jgi:small subunit ribosomal protein S7